MRYSFTGTALLASSCVLALIVACGTDGSSEFGSGPNTGPDGGGSSSLPPGFFDVGDGGDTTPVNAPIAITPADQVVTFKNGSAPPITYVAKVIATGQVVPAIFSIDRGELGNVAVNTGVFTASGSVGGKGKVTASWRGNAASTSVTVNLLVTENGGVPTDAGSGAGGNGGVGGHGPGALVDQTVVDALNGAPQNDAGLSMLYPYDGTVWPRGILAPLLMWKPGALADYDAVMIHLKETSFEYTGTFAANNHPFQDHPISQQVWKQLTQSNAGEDVEVSITLSKDGTAYGPLNTKWKVASAPLKGTVYYNSYGTRLAKNYTGAQGGDGKFGGATLAIRGSSTDPVLVAGSDGDKEYCRVCHSVAANGSKLITQKRENGDRLFITYDLQNGNAQTPMNPTSMTQASADGYAWPAIYPDGSLFIGDSSSGSASHDPQNKMYITPSGTDPVQPTELPMNNWPAGFRAAFPSFSPDGSKLAFTMFGGITDADQKTIGYATFDKNSNAFGTVTKLFKPDNDYHAIYPAFLPTNDGVVFEVVTHPGDFYGATRYGARGELWWTHIESGGGTPISHRLDNLNGKGYIPTGPDQHDDDTTLNYEPTINPVPSGGYAWVVFTSRRYYGNVATIDPWWSDPREHDLNVNATTKKLWVAAIDLNAPPGSDPSHPAFYLPAQELFAGNSRGYWVVDPCHSDGTSCETGDECCGGFCRPNSSGALVCSNVVPTCAQEFEKCSSSSDCCNTPSFTCINGRCAAPEPN